MKIVIGSDLHGSLEYGKKFFERVEEEGAEEVILLGDLLYHGARNDLPFGYSTMGLANLLNEWKDKITAVRGNCDSEIDQTVLEFPIMADYRRIEVDGREWILTHGHLFDEYSMISHEEGAVLLHGHTHIPALEIRRDFFYVNPGSTSIPKDVFRHHSYCVYEDGLFTLKDLLSGEPFRKMQLS